MAIIGDAFIAIRPDADGFESETEKQVGGAFGKIGKLAGAAALATGAAVAGVAAKGIGEFAGFQKGMQEVYTLLPGISADAMGELSDDVLAFSKDAGVLPEETIPSLYSALSAGVPPGNVFDFMETANQAALGGVTELSTAVDGISGVVNAYGSDVISAGEASDVMFTTVRLGKTTFGELSASLGDVTPLAGALGISFEEVGAAMAASTAITGNTAKSTTGLKGLLSELGKEGQVAAKHFEEIAGKSFPDFIASGGDLSGALEIMSEHAADTGGSIVDLFGSVEAGQSALQLTGSEAFNNNLAEMQGSAGATQAAFETMDQGLSRSWDRIKSQASVALIGVGEALAPFVEQLAELAEDVVPLVIAAVERLPEIISAVVAAVQTAVEWFDRFKVPILAIATILAVSYIPALVSAGVASTVSAAQQVAAWTATRLAAIKTVVLAPVHAAKIVAGWVAQGAAAVASGVQTAYVWALYKVEAVKAAAAHVASSARIVAGWVTQAAAATASAVRTAAAWVLGHVTAAAGAVASFAVATAATVAGWVRMGVQSLIGAAKMAAAWVIAMGPIGWVIAGVVALVALIVANWDTVVEWTTKAWTWVSEKVAAAWEWIKEATAAAVEAVVSTVSGWVESVVAFVQGLWDRTTALFTSLKDTVVETVTGLVTAVTDTVSGWVESIVGFVADLLARWVALQIAIRDAVIEAVTNLVTTVATTVAGWVESVVGFVTDLWQRWVNLVHAIRDAVIAAVAALVANVVSTVSGWVTSIVGFVTNLKDRWTALVTGIRDAVVERVTDLAARVRQIVSEWVRRVIRFVEGLKTDFVGTMRKLVTDAVAKVAELPGKILDKVRNFGTLLLNAGRSLITGLITGIREKIAGIGRAIGDAAAQVTRFWPFSPAKEGPLRAYPPEQAGANIVSLMAKGMAGNVRQVAMASEAMARAASPAFDRISIGAPTAGRTATAGRQAADAAGGTGPIIGTMNVYTDDPRRAGDAVIRSLREQAYLNAPMIGR